RLSRRAGQHAGRRRRLRRRAACVARARAAAPRSACGGERLRCALVPRARWALRDPDVGRARAGDRVTHDVAVIAGDGAGREVVAEARKAVDALALDLAWTDL